MIKQLTVLSEEELTQILTIWLEANLEAHSFIAPAYWHDHLALMKELLPQAEVFVSLDEAQQIVGFLGLMDQYIAGIFVAQASRGQGIGKGLLEVAKTRHQQLSLAVYQKNQAAVTFYYHQGFTLKEKGWDEDTKEVELVLVWEK